MERAATAKETHGVGWGELSGRSPFLLLLPQSRPSAWCWGMPFRFTQQHGAVVSVALQSGLGTGFSVLALERRQAFRVLHSS